MADIPSRKMVERVPAELTEDQKKLLRMVNLPSKSDDDQPVSLNQFVTGLQKFRDQKLLDKIVETEGEWEYEEGCLSLPGLAFDIVRPKLVTVAGIDLDGNEVVLQGDDLLGRVFLHEIDHLDGVLMLDRLDGDQRKIAMRELREQGMGVRTPGGRTHAL